MKLFNAKALTVALTATVYTGAAFYGGAALAQTEVKMINPLPRSTVFYPLVVGEALGYFEEEGVTVKLLPSDTSIPYVAFVQNGQADLAMLDQNETINAVIAGAEINTVYEVMQNAPEGIAVSSESNYKSVADLVGTTVGLVSDRDRAFLQAALDIEGKSIDDVKTVVLGESGPTLAAAIRDQTTPDELLASPANTFAMNSAVIDEKREAIEGFLRAWSKGVHVSTFNPEAVEKMLREAVPEEWEDEAAGKSLLEGVIPMNISVTERIGDVQTDVWTNIQPRLLSSGAIEEEVDVSKFLNDTYIDTANDFDRAEVEAEVKAWAEENM